MMNLTLEQELARLASRFGVEALMAGAERVALPDFSQAMANQLQKLVEFKEPVWLNAATGKMASSVFAAFEALGFTTSKHWAVVANEARRCGSFHVRRDLPKSGTWGTICVDLAEVETHRPQRPMRTPRRPKGDPLATGAAERADDSQGASLCI